MMWLVTLALAAEPDLAAFTAAFEEAHQRCAAEERSTNPTFAQLATHVLGPGEHGGVVALAHKGPLGFTSRPPGSSKAFDQCVRDGYRDLTLPVAVTCLQRQAPEGFQGVYLRKPPRAPASAVTVGATSCFATPTEVGETTPAAPPPIAAPCCGRQPIRREAPKHGQEEVAAGPSDVGARAVTPVVGAALDGVTLKQAACQLMKGCRGDCDADPDTPHLHRRSERSARMATDDGRVLWAEVVGAGSVVCFEDEWVLAVEGPTGIAWVPLLAGGGGTKGGVQVDLKRVAALDHGRFWVELQHYRAHTNEPTDVALYGYLVGVRDDGVPVLMAPKIPIWRDGAWHTGPKQIDVAVEADRLVITARTPLLTPEQAHWLGTWTLAPL